jgi:hypothetical protein
MTNTSCSTDLKNRPPIHSRASQGKWPGRSRQPWGRSATNPYHRRFDRVTAGFWLGGVVLGTAGCLVGTRMPYRHPVAVATCVAWWTLYCGCLGASLVALFCWLSERAPAVPSSAHLADSLFDQEAKAPLGRRIEKKHPPKGGSAGECR